MPAQEDTVFLPFGEPGKDQSVVVNLDEGRMSRYLRIAISLQIPKSPASRDLTPAELSLIELLFGEIARAFSRGWPEVEALPVELGEILIRPLRSRIFQPRENLIRSIVVIQTPVGEEAFVILMRSPDWLPLELTTRPPAPFHVNQRRPKCVP